MSARSALPTVAALGLMAIVVASCGDSASDPGQGFVGTWHYDDGTGIVTCEDGNTINLPPTGNKTFAPGLTKGIVDVSISPLDSAVYCNLAYDIVGFVASARAGQVCYLTGGDTFTVTDADAQEYATFTLTSPTQAEELSLGNIHITQPGPLGSPPVMTTCRYDLTGHLTKVAKD